MLKYCASRKWRTMFRFRVKCGSHKSFYNILFLLQGMLSEFPSHSDASVHPCIVSNLSTSFGAEAVRVECSSHGPVHRALIPHPSDDGLSYPPSLTISACFPCHPFPL